MSRYYSTNSDTGLSRQSTKSYKVIRQKSNAELNEKLRRLDIEHNTNIAKILNERYNLRTLHFNLTHSGEETPSDSDSDGTSELDVPCVSVEENEDLHSQEKRTHAPTLDNNKKQTLLQLPSIIEDSPVDSKQHCKSPKLNRSPLPPLSEHGFPTRVRNSSESTHIHPTAVRPARQRSSSFPAGHMPGDRQRKNEFKRIMKHEKTTQGDGRRVGEDMPNQIRIQADDDKSSKPILSWDSELHSCRYLRHKRYSTPDIIDTDSIFDRTPDN